MTEIRTNPQSAAPRLSIVVSTLNAGRTLARCLDSLAGQSFRDFEIIIIDGGSADDTSGIAARYGALVSHFQSEPDKGIYDAWNKALRLVRGEWICFLGADDRFTTPDALIAFSLDAVYPETTLVCARVDMTDATGTVVRSSGEAWELATMKKYMCVAHPGAWHHRSLFETYGEFDPSYRVAGDYEFLLRCTASIRAKFVPQALVTMELGGVSNRFFWRHVTENYSVLTRSAAAGRFHAVRFLLRASLGRTLRKLGFGSGGARSGDA
jgi:glycosyltransferase involved in cell wall biosynthesis